MLHALDPIKLYAGMDAKAWNCWLRDCLNKKDLNQLIEVKKRLQMGMDVLSKSKLNDRKISCQFLRWCKSIDETVTKIIRRNEFNPCDNPLEAAKNMEHHAAKKKRDYAVEKFLIKESF